MKKLMMFAAVLGVAIFVYLSIDHSPSAIAESLRNSNASEDRGPSRAYRILLGMGVQQDDDALAVGGEIISHYYSASADIGILDEDHFVGYSDDRALSLPVDDEDELYCNIIDEGCLDRIAVSASERNLEIERLSVLMSRHRDYLQAGDYRTEIPIAMSEPWVDFRVAMVANRLDIFSALSMAENGQPADAIDNLFVNIEQLRGLLAASDMLVHKVITALQLRDSLEAVAYIHGLYDEKDFTPLAHLSVSERSLELPLRNEYLLVDRVAEALDGSAELLSEEFNTPGWIGKRVFRRNLLMNIVADRINAQVALSQLDPEEIHNALDIIALDDDPIFSVLPSVNEAMKVMADVDFTKYIGIVHDLNVKISLVNAQITGDPRALVNPYYPTKELALESVGTAACMDGPLPDDKKIRCLDIIGISEALVTRID